MPNLPSHPPRHQPPFFMYRQPHGAHREIPMDKALRGRLLPPPRQRGRERDMSESLSIGKATHTHTRSRRH